MQKLALQAAVMPGFRSKSLITTEKDRHRGGENKQHTYFSEVSVKNRLAFTWIATPAENPPLGLPASQESFPVLHSQNTVSQ